MTEKARSDRSFEMVTASDPTDQFHRVRIRCSEKDCKETFIFTRRGPINPIHAAKWFRDKGWFVGGHQRADLCPQHWKGSQDMAKSKQKVFAPANGGANIQTKHSEINLGTGTAIPPPIDFDDLKISAGKIGSSIKPVEPEAAVTLSMSRADKRIIYNKLDEVYADELTGYRGNWNDEKVAIDLGVPKEWVSSIREDTFGPEINKEKMKEEVDRLVNQINDGMKAYNENVIAIQGDIKQYDKLMETLDKRLDAFDQTVTLMRELIYAFEIAVKELKG